MTAPLAGIRVVDLTMVWAGPFGTRLLGDYGAEVIKVEGPGQWDLLRGLGGIPRTVDRWYNRAAYFNHNNRNKYSAAIDLRQEAGRDLLLQLLAKSDVLVENYRANVMDNLGLSFEEVRAANPRIVYVSMPGHGKTGPEAHYVTYGTNVEQLAGLVSVSGYEGGEPLKTGFSYGDPTAGLAVPAAVALGLRQRNRTGEGVHIDLAQRENLTGFVGEYLVDYSMNGEPRAPAGNTHPHFAPHGVYPSGGEDRWITIACENDEQFAALCRAMQQGRARRGRALRHDGGAQGERAGAGRDHRGMDGEVGALRGDAHPAAPRRSRGGGADHSRGDERPAAAGAGSVVGAGAPGRGRVGRGDASLEPDAHARARPNPRAGVRRAQPLRVPRPAGAGRGDDRAALRRRRHRRRAERAVAHLDRLHKLQAVPVAAEVSDVEGEQPALAGCEHGRDDVGVVDLPARHGHLATQRDEHVRDVRSVFKDLELTNAGSGHDRPVQHATESGLTPSPADESPLRSTHGGSAD